MGGGGMQSLPPLIIKNGRNRNNDEMVDCAYHDILPVFAVFAVQVLGSSHKNVRRPSRPHPQADAAANLVSLYGPACNNIKDGHSSHRASSLPTFRPQASLLPPSPSGRPPAAVDAP